MDFKKKNQERDVERWNAKNPVGVMVLVQKDDGSIYPTRTRSQAWMLSGHTAVIQVEGISGAYALERVKRALD